MDDKIFLMSMGEYRNYRTLIPEINTNWWLRSAGDNNFSAAIVNHNGSGNTSGKDVAYNGVAVRPILNVEDADTSNLKFGDRIIRCGFPWIVIEKGYVIAEVPIAFRRFDVNSNDYDTSEVRRFLLDWYAARCNIDNKENIVSA